MGMISNENLNEFLKEVREKAKGEDKLLEQFERCFLNTLETTVKMKEDGTVYVITGDIPAMWLRDSTAQIRPFLFPAKENEEIAEKILCGEMRTLPPSLTAGTGWKLPWTASRRQSSSMN